MGKHPLIIKQKKRLKKLLAPNKISYIEKKSLEAIPYQLDVKGNEKKKTKN